MITLLVMQGVVVILQCIKKSIILGDHEGNFYPNGVKSFKYLLYKKDRKIKNDTRFKKYLEQQIKIHKNSLDPFMLYKLDLI